MKRVIVVVICLMMLFGGVAYGLEGYSDVVEVTKDVISLGSDVVKSPVGVGEVSGRTVTNLLNNNGDCEDKTKWYTTNSSILTDYSTDKVFGSQSIKFEHNGQTSAGFTKEVTSQVDISKYYFISGYVKTDGAANVGVGIYLADNTYNSIGAVPRIKPTTWIRTGMKISPTNFLGKDTSMIRFLVNNSDSNMSAITYVDGLMLVEITADEYNNISVDELMDKYNFMNSTKSTNSVVINSEGINRFDEKLESGAYSTTTGEKTAGATYRSVNMYRVKGGQSYPFFSNIPGGYRFFYYDINRNFISTELKSSVPTTFIPPDDGFVSFHTSAINSSNVDTAEICIGSSSYAKYEKSEVQVTVLFNDGELTRLPNNSYDSVNFVTGDATQKNQKYILQSGNIVNLYTTPTNVDYVAFNKSILSSYKYIGQGGTDVIGSMLIDGYTEYISSSGLDNIANIGKFALRADLNQVYLIVAKGTYADLAAAQADLAGTTLIYQLAQSPDPEKLTTTPLTAYPNGTITIEPAVQEVSVYNNGITISDPTLPIEEIESVYKIENGVLSPADYYDLAQDKLSFKVTNAQKGDTYQFTYKYSSALTTIPTMKYSTAVNQDGQIDSSTNAINRHSELIELILEQIQTLKNEINDLKEQLGQ